VQGSVNVPAFAQPVLLAGRAALNRAVHGDVVAVQVLPEAQWRAPGDALVDQDGARPSHRLSQPVRHADGDAATLKDDDAADSEDEGEGEGARAARAEQAEEAQERRDADAARTPRQTQPTGRVVGIVKRNWRPCARLPPCSTPR
jgi:exosome complex exonuclease DIS3/RRP44